MEVKNEENTPSADEQKQNRTVLISFSRQPPAQIKPGGYFTLRVRATCKEMPQLEGLMVHILDHQGSLLRALRLMVAYPRCSDTDQVVFQAPAEAGEYTWTALFPAQQLQGITYGEARADFTFSVPADHPVSMIVWNAPDTVTAGETFTPRIGVKCSACCNLAGQMVRILDGQGNMTAQARLGGEPCGESGAVYWADVPVTVNEPGEYSYIAEYLPEDGDPVHQPARRHIAFCVERPADYTVRVTVTARRNGLPVEETMVSLRPYQAKTDKEGKTSLKVPKGKYRLIVSGQDMYSMYAEDVWVSGDTTLQVVLEDAPPLLDGIG